MLPARSSAVLAALQATFGNRSCWLRAFCEGLEAFNLDGYFVQRALQHEILVGVDGGFPNLEVSFCRSQYFGLYWGSLLQGHSQMGLRLKEF